MEVATDPVVEHLARFDHRRALQVLSHAARTRNLRGTSAVTYSFVVYLDVGSRLSAAG